MTVLARKMTDLEKARLRKFKKNHKGAKAYYSTDFSLGVGYDIIASTLDLTQERNRLLIDETNSKFITDEKTELEKWSITSI
jgi:type II secretory pathway component HofQ